MCGIHATIHIGSSPRQDLSHFVRQAFTANSLRGIDSSGVFQIDREFKPFTYKEAIAGPDFARSAKAEPYLNDAQSSLATICHVRAKTQGAVNKKNAHPFTAYTNSGARLLGVHNGTLSNWKNKTDGDRYEVDSEWALNRIAEIGVDAFKEIHGAYAFMWWNEETPDKLFIARNSQRPLHMALSKDKKSAMFASESGMLQWLIERNRIFTDGTLYEIKDGLLFEFDISKDAKEVSWSTTKLPFPVYTSTSTSTTNKGTTQSSSSSGSCGWDYDDSPWDEWGYSWHGQQDSRDTRAGRAGHDSLVARVRAVIEQNVTEPKEEAKQEEGQIVEQRTDDQPTFQLGDDYIIPEKYWKQFLEYADVEDSEVESARKSGILGQLQWFEGVIYDDTESSMWGDVEEYVPGKGKVLISGVVRGLSQTAADDLFCTTKANNREGDWAIVIGSGEPMEGQTGGYYVLLPIPTEARKLLSKAA